jgi:hypothetical protein
MMISNVSCDLLLMWNHQLKFNDDKHTAICKNENKKLGMSYMNLKKVLELVIWIKWVMEHAVILVHIYIQSQLQTMLPCGCTYYNIS